MSKLKAYKAHVQFEAIGVKVMAKNAHEAKKKVLAKVAKRKVLRLVDRNNLFVDRLWSNS